MIQTHYVPLERPYRIVYTGGVMGLQVGTLIVVQSKTNVMKKGGVNVSTESMTTQTHPVVSYVNKEINLKQNVLVCDMMFGGTGMFSEAVVWDQVEQKDVATLCLEGQIILWEDFLNIITPLISECHDEDGTRERLIKARHFFSNIRSLGAAIASPEGHNELSNYFGENEAYEFQIQLVRMPYDKEDGTTTEPCFCTEFGAELPFVARTDDREIAFKILQRQRSFYKTILLTLSLHPIRLYFEAGGCCEDVADEDVVALAARLNTLP